MPAYRHRVPAGRGLVVGPGRRRQPSTCWINTVTGLAPLSGRWIIVMAITRGIVTIVPSQIIGIGMSQGVSSYPW